MFNKTQYTALAQTTQSRFGTTLARFALALALLGTFSTVPIVLAADDLPARAKDWKLLGSTGEVISGNGYCFRNQTVGQSIKYGHRGYLGGINLVWDKSSNLSNVHFERQDKRGAVNYGDKIALRVDGIKKPYIRYHHRDIGINLTWSAEPVHEWVIVGGKEGVPVRVGEPFALLNLVEKDFLIYAKRGGEAINLRWYLDRNKGGYMDQARELVKDKGFDYIEKYIGP